jgi:MazG family protein
MPHRIEPLLDLVTRLRGPGGCPWDRAQTPETMRPYLLEEAHEVVAAVDAGDTALARKELGDLLFLVVSLSAMYEDAGAFTFDDVVRGVVAKMVARHPHVFDPNHRPASDEGALDTWEARKAKERDAGSALDGVPAALPALLRAHRIGEKASRVGFDWPDRAGVRAKVDEELAELDEALAAGDPAHVSEEFGDVLLALANLGRFLPTSGEDALRQATSKFERRFRWVEADLAASGRSVHDVGLDELEAAWQRAKRSA